MKTLEMMNLATQTGKSYINKDMRYSAKKGFYDDCGDPWDADAFNTLNDVLDLDNWEETKTREMTIEQIEEILGYAITIV